MKMSQRTAKKEAFTLLEIIIALSMLVLILGSVYGTYTAATRALAQSKPRHALQQQARIFLQRIASEIRCCYAGYREKSEQSSTRIVQREGEKHLQQEEPSLFEGGEVSSGQIFLQFVTSAVASRREHNLGGLAIVEYMFDSSMNTLSRRKRRYIGKFEVEKDNNDWIIILENVQTITVKYFNGEDWLDEWYSNDMKGFLPKAVEISLVMQSEDIGPLSFEYKVQIDCRVKQSGSVTVQKSSESDKILQSIRNNQSSDE